MILFYIYILNYYKKILLIFEVIHENKIILLEIMILI